MIIEQGLHDKLAATAAITALVSTRIYYVRAPANVTAPYVTIQKISAPRGHTYTGPSGLAEARFQLNIIASTYTVCKSIAAAIQAVLDGFSGVMGTGGVNVGGCFYDNETDLPYDDELGLYGLAVDYLITHEEV